MHDRVPDLDSVPPVDPAPRQPASHVRGLSGPNPADGPHSPHVAQKRRERIRRILRTALDVVRADGRDGLTLKRVAEAQGLTTAALYRYFPSKDALIAELQCAVIGSLSVATRERVNAAASAADAASAGAWPRTDRALLAIVVSGFAFEAYSRTSAMEFGILTTDLSQPDHTLPDHEAALVFDAAWAALSELAARLHEAESCGALEAGDPSARAVALWASLQGVVQARKLARSAPERIDSMRIAQGVVSTLLIGWGADAKRVDSVVDFVQAKGLATLPKRGVELLDRTL